MSKIVDVFCAQKTKKIYLPSFSASVPCSMWGSGYRPGQKKIGETLPMKVGGENGELDFGIEGVTDLFKRWFLFSLVWSVGGNLVAASKEIFSEFVREKHAEDPP